jgi:hypothetical protein
MVGVGGEAKILISWRRTKMDRLCNTAGGEDFLFYFVQHEPVSNLSILYDI